MRQSGAAIAVAADHVIVGDERVEHGRLRAPEPDRELLIMAVAAIYYVLVLARRTDWNLHGPDELAG
ncbi:hypothetical protein [Mesorhizobium sp. LNHC221B00]|uniref:hypothetical protein n=1 Tax=Mesorhizobium sp. LNHC221B00 TaxID=1287233 RepID=UPI0012EB6AF6|nr:hypothetical protein [Mesorhizobium sp. LNHC221B00]